MLFLAELYKKYESLLKELRFKMLAEPNLYSQQRNALADVKTVTLSDLKELTLILNYEKEMWSEKAMRIEIEAAEMKGISDFYFSLEQKMGEFVEKIWGQKDSASIEKVLEDFEQVISIQLYEARRNAHKDHEALAKKTAEVNALIEKEDEKMRNMTLKETLRIGERQDDDSILKLASIKCLNTNLRLRRTVSSMSKRLITVNERYMWEREALVDKVAEDPCLLERYDDQEENHDSGLSINRTDSEDAVVFHETRELIRYLAQLGRNAEGLIKYHSRLSDLKVRIIDATKKEFDLESTHSIFRLPSD